MNALVADIRFAFRQLRRAPGFTIAAVLTLGLGIGVNATVFNWANRMFRHPLPGVDSSNLYYLRWTFPGGGRGSTSWPDYLETKKRSRALSQIAAARQIAFSLGEGSRPERIFGMLVSANFFETLGVRPQLGRTFVPAEDEGAGAHAVAVISDALWRHQLSADPGIVGRTIRLNTRSFTVAGVMPPGFLGSTVGLRHEVWVPVVMRGEIMGGASALTDREDRWLEAYFRIAPGVTLQQATQELDSISAQLEPNSAATGRFVRADVIPIWKHGAGQVIGPVLLVMGGVAGMILLIACANAGNLLLARSAARRREIAVRLALGVSRSRLIRQLLVESAVLAALGAMLALAAIPATSGLLTRFAPPVDFSIDLNARPDWLVAAFTLGVAGLATLLFGFTPAWRAAGVNPAVDLVSDASGTVSGTRLRGALVVVQVALSVLLLSGAGLLLRSLGYAMAAAPGFDPRGVAVAGVDLFPNGYAGERSAQFVRQALERLARIPGVTNVSTVRRVPLSLSGNSTTGFSADGYTQKPGEPMTTFVHTAGPGYFTTMKTPLVAGRDLWESDGPASSPVIVINQTLASRYFAGTNPLGRHIRFGGSAYTIIGVAADSKHQSLDEPAASAVYLNVLQRPVSETSFLLRTSGLDVSALTGAIRAELRAIDPALPVHSVRPLEDVIGAAYIAQRMGGWLLTLFGALALGLAVVGLAGVLAFSVGLRRREMGIRLALGATPAEVRNLILAGGMRLTAIGLAIGVALSAALSPLLGKLLYGVDPRDGVTLGGASVILAAAGMAAALVPARKAAGIDPLEAMRG